MKKIITSIIVAALLLVTLACSFTINTPKVTVGETKTFNLDEPVPVAGETTKINIEMGAGKLNISGGAANLIEGTIRYNIFAWEPKVTREDKELSIHQGTVEEIRIPDEDVINEWDFKLGTDPIDLKVAAGAYEGMMDFSGSALTNLEVQDGASKATIEFSTLNPVEMELFSYQTGASQVKIYGIGNANTNTFTFDGGAGDFTLDFSGDLQRDLNVDITAGVSSLTIVIPEGIPARLTVEGGLNNVSPSGTWTINGNVYEKSGSGPAIDIYLEMGVGSLELISR